MNRATVANHVIIMVNTSLVVRKRNVCFPNHKSKRSFFIMLLFEKTEYHIAIDIAVKVSISRVILDSDLTEHARVLIPQMKCYLNLYRKVICVGGTGERGMDGRISNRILIIDSINIIDSIKLLFFLSEIIVEVFFFCWERMKESLGACWDLRQFPWELKFWRV